MGNHLKGFRENLPFVGFVANSSQLDFGRLNLESNELVKREKLSCDIR